MPLTRDLPAELPPEHIAAAIESFLAAHPGAVVLEDGKVLFDLRNAKYSLATEHSRCTLHLWSDERNLVRRIAAATPRSGSLRLTAHRFGQSRPQSLELVSDPDRRTPSAREATRTQYLRLLERVLQRHFTDWKLDSLRTAMDLERSFGPAYARGVLTRGQHAWAVIAVNADEPAATIDGILTLGILWLSYCREKADGKKLFQGLKLIVPSGSAALTASRIAWLNPAAAQWELYELDQRTEDLTPRDAADHGNLLTRILHAPSEANARERFADSTARIMALVQRALESMPAGAHAVEQKQIDQRLRSSTELAFLLHGLEFARIRIAPAAGSFRHEQTITLGAGPSETELTPDNEPQLTAILAELFARRTPDGDPKDPLFRMQPERWLESELRRSVAVLDESLDPEHVYTQVPAFAASDRGMLDLLSVTRRSSNQPGRLAVIELKAEDDLHLALQGLDYWVRVRWHHLQPPHPTTGLGEFQRRGYFPSLRLSPEPPLLFLAAPALRIHPATETVLSYLSPRVEWTLVALDERWRTHLRVIWRKRSQLEK